MDLCVNLYVVMANFSGSAWAFKGLASKHTQTSVWHARAFASTFQRPEYGPLR
jgi:hypothetical protein